MTISTATPASHSVRAPRARIAYLDAARALAIIGMFLAHIAAFVPIPAPIEFLVSGRASIMFAVLAGVSTALIARSHAVTDRERLGFANRNSSRDLLVRAIILFLIGITLPLLSGKPYCHFEHLRCAVFAGYSCAALVHSCPGYLDCAHGTCSADIVLLVAHGVAGYQ